MQKNRPSWIKAFQEASKVIKKPLPRKELKKIKKETVFLMKLNLEDLEKEIKEQEKLAEELEWEEFLSELGEGHLKENEVIFGWIDTLYSGRESGNTDFQSLIATKF